MAQRNHRTLVSFSPQQEADLELLTKFTGRAKTEHVREAMSKYLKEELGYFMQYQAERKLLGMEENTA